MYLVRYPSAITIIRLAALGASLISISVFAEPVHQPSGTNLTYGSLTHGQRVHSTTSNPAAAAANLSRKGRKAASGTVLSFSSGIEYGNFDDIFDALDETSKAFEPSDPGDDGSGGDSGDPEPENPREPIDIGVIIDTRFPDLDKVVEEIADEVVKRAAALALIAAEGHAKAFASVDAPFVFGTEVLGGAWTFGANWSGTAKAIGLARPIEFDADQVLDDLKNQYDPTQTPDNRPRLYDLAGDVNLFVDQATGNYGLDYSNDSSLLTKAATTLELSLGYSWFGGQVADGNLYYGVEGKFYDLALSRLSVRFGDITDSQELFDSIRDSDFDYDQGIGVDLGVMWVGPSYQVGATLNNVYESEFEYPAIDFAPYSDRSMIDLLQRDRTYVMERQLKLEASLFSANHSWNFNLGIDANEIEDPVGDDFQWLTASVGYATDSWWLPGVRFGYRQNLAGTELNYASVGVTAFRILNIDIASTLDRVTIDGENLPQSLIVNIGFDISF